MTSSSRWPGIAALLFATSSWGGMFLVSQSVLRHMDPLWMTALRYTLSALFFAALLLPRGMAPWRKLRLHALPLALRGAAGFGVFSVLLLAGLAHSVPSHGAIIVATTPMTTQLLRWALDGVRPSRTGLLTTLLALAGVAVVSGLVFGAGASASHTMFGDTLTFAGTLGWIWYTRGAARFTELDVVEYSALTVLASWPLLLIAALAATVLGWVDMPDAQSIQLCWPALLYVGLVSSAVAVLAFNYGVRALGAVTGTAFFNFVPVSALLMSVALGKLPTASELIGMAMVIAALLIHTATNRTGIAARPTQPAPARQNPGSTCGVTP